ncbi:MAG: hypothetical protein IH991_13830 [Planctomycetes bacterium]|nr:hypothetical protein [Planctomycetota bacterium]
MIHTQDGGRTWRQVADRRLPWLTQVRFINVQHGYVVGMPSAMHPSGLFRSNDSGRTWVPITTPNAGHWHAGFRNGGEAILVADTGTAALLQQDRVVKCTPIQCGLQSIQQVAASAGRIWVVDNGNHLFVSETAGKSWNLATRLRELVSDNFDFKTLAVVGDNCWVAGAPGSCVFHSRNGGRNWSVLHTNQTLPIHSMTFVDEHRGWAVGSLGVILATRDGGRNWHVQRSGGNRLAMLGIFSQARKVPLELFTKTSGNDGLLGAVEILNRWDVEVASWQPVTLARRTHEALLAVGACGAETSWRFPNRQAGLRLSAESIVDGWNGATGGKSVEVIEKLLVRTIRQWRPAVVVTEPASPRGNDPLSHLTNQITLSAIEKAADRNAYSQQIAMGLAPWTVKKVIAPTTDNNAATFTVKSAQLALRLGSSLTDTAKLAESRLVNEYHPSPASTGFQLLKTEVAPDLARQSIFSGIEVRVGEGARRMTSTSMDQASIVRRAAQKQRNITAMVAMSDRVGPESSAWLGQLNELTRGLSRQQAGQVLFQMASQYRQHNRADLAAEVAMMLVRQFPDHSYWDATATWLMQFYSSGETLLRMQNSGAIEAQVTGGGARRTKANTHRAPMTTLRRKALALVRIVEKQRPDLLAEPAFCFSLIAAQRSEGIPQSTGEHLQSLVLHPYRPWAECARAEFWLKRRNAAPPKPVAHCVAVTTRPRLDGKLDEAVWRNAQPLVLRSGLHDDSDWPAVVFLAHDNDYLYLAVRCRKAPGFDYQKNDEPRRRDTDLSARDRIEILVDIDRDYGTYYRLTVDHRGWPNETFLRDRNWNPDWYIYASDDDDTWTIEAAIEMKDIAPRRQRTKKVWGLGVQRIVPNVGFQSWTTHAGIEPRPEGFGLLMLE